MKTATSKLLAVPIALGGHGITKLSAWLKTRMTAAQYVELKGYVSTFVQAAEQMYKAEAADGFLRQGYVEGQLTALGYKITDYVRALIEAKVLEMSIEIKTTK